MTSDSSATPNNDPHAFEFEVPDAHLIDRVRVGLIAHQARNEDADRRARLATALNFAAAGISQVRLPRHLEAVPIRLSRATG